MLRRHSFLSLAAAAGALALAACGGEGGAASSGASAGGDGSVEIYEYDARPSDMVLGDPNAPVTIVEYASVTCPHCANFHASTFKPLKEKYIDTGKVKFVFREFPTAPAQLAVAGFLLARCAADNTNDEAYFTMLDALFRKQRDWIGPNARDELLQMSAAVGLNQQQFETCVQNEEEVDRLRQDIEHASNAYDIAGTPTFLVNGEKKQIFTIEQFDEVLAPLLGEEPEALPSE